MTKKTPYIIAGILGCILVNLFFVFFALKQIPIGDQVFDLVAADSFAKKIPTEYLETDSRVHPPVYTLAVSSVMKRFSIPGVKAAKLLGVACFLIALSLIYFIVLQLSPPEYGHIAALLAASLYAVNPMVIQGSQVLKLDTSILPVAMLLFVFAFIKREQNIRLSGAAVLGIFFSFVLFTKFSTALAIPVAVGLFFIFKKEYTRGLFSAGIISIVGIGLFWFFWFILRRLYPYPFGGLPFFCHFGVISGEYGVRLVKTLAEQIQEWAKCSIIVLWVSPYFVLLWLMAVTWSIKKYRSSGYVQPRDFLVLCAFVILSGYFTAGGLAHGFPRYQFPAFSLCVITAAMFSAENFAGEIKKRYLIFGTALALVSTVYNLTVGGDMIYNVYYMLRFNAAFPVLAVNDAVSGVSWRMFYGLCLLLSSFLACRLLFPPLPVMRRWILILLPLTLGANLSQDVLNARAPYQTGYTYGGAGIKEVIDLLSKELSQNKKILAPDDISFHLPGIIVHRRMKDWTSPELFMTVIKEKAPDLVVYGLSSNSVSQYQKTFNNREVQLFLKTRFPVREDIGSYTIFKK